MLNFVQTRLMEFVWPAEMSFLGSNLVNFDLWPLAASDFEKKINSFRRWIVGSFSMSMLNFVPIRWIESICRAEMWFVGSNLVTFWPLTPGSHLEFREKSKSLAEVHFWGHQYVHANFCPNQINGICITSRNVIFGVKFGLFWPSTPDGHLRFWKK